MCFCRFLIVWTSFLPFALFNQFQWLTPFVCAIVTFLLFGVRLLSDPIHDRLSYCHIGDSPCLTSP